MPLMLALAGVLVILASVVAAVVVRSSDTATLALGERPDVPVVVTGPGVLDAVDPEVTVRATAGDDEQVVLAIGRSSEVDAWLDGADHMRVTGLSSWEELTTEVVTGAPAAAPTDAPTDGAEEPAEQPAGLPDPAGSDLWVVETVSTGSAELSWSDSPGRWSLVAATDGTGPAPQIELEWGRQVSTPWLVPGIVVGVLALVAGVTMLVLDVLARREERRREAGRTEGPARSITDTDPGTGERLTRRQIRELEALDHSERARATGDALPPPVPFAPGDDAHTDDADAVVTDHAATRPEPAVHEPEPLATAGPDDEARAGEVEPLEPALEEVEPQEQEPEPAELAPEESAGTPDGSPEADDEEGYEPAPPSWRSVWGFGGTAGPRTPPTQPMDDDGEERR
ncbi:hypothetical protein SAMN05216184_10360 [Georgenia satyanarayanai]|uniref:Uncharacterized protein n=2 Tax=Georgenia satyanarayanai TaxID=860221 RepID=A0A2Y9ABF4_9MICO|nr:hypothetical protein A8987_10360 [Georgenia satyanarayanai]SSA39879.1 hypothetical protein SAMN05216184_10360 [Georgenia satyanarayanai]